MTFAPSANTGFVDRGDLRKGRLPRTLRVLGTLGELLGEIKVRGTCWKFN